jgi:hypothetical protein
VEGSFGGDREVNAGGDEGIDEYEAPEECFEAEEKGKEGHEE